MLGPEVSLILALVLFAGLALLRVPIAFSLLAAGAVGLLLQEGSSVALSIMSTQPYRTTAAFTLVVVPLFIALGVFVKGAGVPEQLYYGLSRRVGRIPGGLPLATVGACAVFAAVSGSSAATVAMIGKIGIEEMVTHGYSRRLAAGVVGAAGTLGILIPPSIALVLFGIVVGESVAALLLAGIIPGILSAMAYAVAIVLWELRRPSTAYRTGAHELPAVVDDVVTTRPGGNEDGHAPMLLSTGAAFGIVGFIFLVVIGGIYGGIFTPVEASAVGAVLAFAILVAQVARNRPRHPLRRLTEPVREAVSLTAMIFAIFVGAGLFNDLLTRGGIPRAISEWAGSAPVPPLLIVALFLVLLVPLGMVLDGTAMLLIVAPLAYPVVSDLGYDGLWFGILFIKMIELGLITPPLGLNVYILAGVSDQVSVADAFRGVARFAVVDVLVIALLFLIPSLTTFLPTLSG